MRIGSKIGIIASTLAAVAVPVATAANAKCTRLAFSVNDYGKEGPTNDAKRMLDKYIAKWTADRGITNYQTGPKKVTCELYLDLLLFDEHTCKAEASVCWADAGTDGTAPPVADGSSTAPANTPSKTVAKPAEPAPAPAPQQAAAPVVEAPPAPSPVTTITPPAPSVPASKTVEAAPGPSPSPVTTGSVGATSGGAVVPPLEPDSP